MQQYLKIGYYLQEIKITINMKIILSFSWFLFAFSGYSQTTTQNQQKHLPDYFIFNIVITIILTSMMQI
jgi:hypothetical protein